MKQNYLWIGLALLVIIIAAVFIFRSPAPAVTTDTGSQTSSTTADTSASGTYATGGKPVVTTDGFASVSSTTAVVVGTVIPNGAATTYWFEYGTTTAFGLAVNQITSGSGYNKLGAGGYMTNLNPNTTYYFRIGATNAYGTSYGGVYSFITAAK